MCCYTVQVYRHSFTALYDVINIQTGYVYYEMNWLIIYYHDLYFIDCLINCDTQKIF